MTIKVLMITTMMNITSGGNGKPGAEFGGTEKCFADKDEVFSEKYSIVAAKISDNLFLVIDQVFRIFPLFSAQEKHIFPIKCRT